MGPHDGAVATVVGAILVVSIVVVGLITFRTSFVPTWEEEAEQQFMDSVAQALLRVRGDVDQLVGPPERGRLTSPVPTSQGQATPSAPPREGNLLSLENRTRTVTVHADDATVWRRNDTLQLRENMGFVSITGGDVTIGGIEAVVELRARIGTVDSGEGGDSFLVRIIGAGGVHGILRYTVEDTRTGGGGSPERSELVAEVEDSAGDIVFDQTVATFTQTQNDYEVDLLDPLLGFDQILASTPTPLRLVIIENGLAVERALTFEARNATSGATVTVPSGGEEVDAFHRSFRGGILRYESRNNFFTDQTYHLEHGALALKQADGSALRAGPPAPAGRVEAGLSDPRAKVGLDLPSLAGPNETFSGAGSIAVDTEETDEQGARVVAPTVHLNFTTSSPEAWASWARDHYREAGLTAGAGEFDVETGDDWMNLTVEGPSLLAGTDDVHLDLTRTEIETTLER